MDKLKITMVGGGSYNWSPTLLCDLMHEETLTGSEIILYDINLQAASEMKAAADRIAKDNNKKFTFIATDNEETAYTDADFVIITISTGGLETMAYDIAIPEEYGIIQNIGDSVGPGGWNRTLRNIPVFTGIAQSIEKYSPRAIVLNYSNPMAALTGIFHQVSNLRALGLCHGPIGTIYYLAHLFDTNVRNMSTRIGGINHLFWIVDFTINGKDGYELLEEKLHGERLVRYDKSHMAPDGIMERDHEVLSEIYANYGYLTYSADEHTTEFFPCYLHDEKTLATFKISRKSMAWREQKLADNRQRVLDMAAGKIPMSEQSAEIAINIIKAVATNTPLTDVVNLPNIGQIDNLPRGAVVETFGTIDGCGFAPVAIGSLPKTLQQACMPHCEIQLMTTEAALTGNKKLALDALLMDPLSQHLTPSKIKEMGKELMAATAEHLPQFK